MSDGLWFDWSRILAYDAKITMVIGERGLGKTFGLRLQCIRDYIKHGWRFVALVRYATELQGGTAIQQDYFGKIQAEGYFLDYVFKIEGTRGYIAKRPESEDEKPKWELICYFLALTQQHKYKGMAFPLVKRIVFDEAILPRNVGARYLTNEVDQIYNMFSTIAREKPGEQTPCRLYLLGNALDLNNPYFAAWCVKEPQVGTQWLIKKSNASVLLHYSDDKAFQSAMADTVVGQLVAGSTEGKRIMENKFAESDSKYICERPACAKFRYGFRYRGTTYGIWYAWELGEVYVSPEVPENTKKPIYTLVADDATMNSQMISKAVPQCKSIVKLFYVDCVRFEDAMTMAGFMELLERIGVMK